MDSAGAVRQSQFEDTGFDYSSRLGSVEEMPLYLYLTRVACTQTDPRRKLQLVIIVNLRRASAERARVWVSVKFIIDNPSFSICSSTSLRCWVDFLLSLGNLHYDGFLPFKNRPISAKRHGRRDVCLDRKILHWTGNAYKPTTQTWPAIKRSRFLTRFYNDRADMALRFAVQIAWQFCCQYDSPNAFFSIYKIKQGGAVRRNAMHSST